MLKLAAPALAASAALAGCSATPVDRSAGGILSLEVPAAASADAPEVRRGSMRVGERLEVRLGAYGGTGYSWTLAGPIPANMQMTTADPAGAVSPANDAGGDGKTPRVGGATVTTFGMNAVAQGGAHMRFVLARPWEKGPESRPARTVDVDIEVDPARAASAATR